MSFLGCVFIRVCFPKRNEAQVPHALEQQPVAFAETAFISQRSEIFDFRQS
jgi:hypothetical protein